MPGTPPSFAGTPKGSVADHDVLAEMLRAVRLNGSVFLNACFTEPFGILSPKRYDEAAPLSHLRHISIFHLIAEGICTVELKSGECRTVTAGEILLLPFADAHRLSNGETSEQVSHPIWFDRVRSRACGASITAAAAARHEWLRLHRVV